MGTDLDRPEGHLLESERRDLAEARHSRGWEALAVILTESTLFGVAALTGLPWFILWPLVVGAGLGAWSLARKIETTIHYHHTIPLQHSNNEVGRLKGLLSTEVDERERLEIQLARRRADQAFADFLTNRIGWATPELLNRVVDVAGGDGQGLRDWQVDAANWRATIVDRMKQHGCTPQEIQRVDLRITVPSGGFFDIDPVMNQHKAGLADLLVWLRSLAEAYSEGGATP